MQAARAYRSARRSGTTHPSSWRSAELYRGLRSARAPFASKALGQCDRPDDLAIASDRITIGHPRDEVGDVPAPPRLVDWQRLAPLGRHPRRIRGIGREQPRHHAMRRFRRLELARMMVEIGIHEALEPALGLAHL